MKFLLCKSKDMENMQSINEQVENVFAVFLIDFLSKKFPYGKSIRHSFWMSVLIYLLWYLHKV